MGAEYRPGETNPFFSLNSYADLIARLSQHLQLRITIKMTANYHPTKGSADGQERRFSLAFLLCLQAILAGLLAYVVVLAHARYPEESSLSIIAKSSLAICFLLILAFQALA